MSDEIEESGVSSQDVKACIEFMLGRTPSDDLVDYHLSLDFKNKFELGRYIASTAEFQAFQLDTRFKPIFLGDRVMAKTHRGEVIYLIPQDLDLTPAILSTGRYEVHVEQAILSCLRPGNTIVDIGANVGYHTMAIAGAYGRSCKVHAFEANPAISPLLLASLFVNGYASFRGKGQVDLYPVAVSDKPGQIILEAAPGHFGSGHIVTERIGSDFGEEYSQRTTVKSVRLDDILASVPSVDFLHMDIEGAEPLAIAGAHQLLERSLDIRILTEWSASMMSTLADVNNYVDDLLAFGFRFWKVEKSGFVPVPSGDVLNLGHCDLLISRHDPY
ncbi:FkbM family methyltransferase [uncultured Brevundimonas sp.]|uniref:FkbM family methyltransferase n=1 Tax=uncultured Brevundimonas sp. TaxID=213418 RepID=UPI002620352A|nr:FkbM family methyltransferase [uncultured Brevundimonas sp.]